MTTTDAYAPEGETFLILSGHDFRSPRQANMHFIARELAARGQVRWFSFGFSYLSRIKRDPRLSLWKKSNEVAVHQGVECFLWRSFLHPVNLHRASLAWLETLAFKTYAGCYHYQMRQWMKEATTIIFESGMSVLWVELARQVNPRAKLIYNCSDALSTIGCSGYLSDTLQRVAPLFDTIRIPSPHLRGEFPAGCNLVLIPQGMDAQVFHAEEASPYKAGVNLVSVGSMLFDAEFFTTVAPLFPDYHFHIIGAGKSSLSLRAPNITVYGEMPFKQTLPYIRYADAGIAPYQGDKVTPYLVDTSMKLMQFSGFGLPAICPQAVAGNKPGRFGYTPGNADSMRQAVQAALALGRFEGVQHLAWKAVTDRLLAPQNYADTRLAPS